MDDLSKWSAMMFNTSTIRSVNVVDGKKSAVLYLDFCNEKDKVKFMKFAKSQQREPNGKYKAITPEQIFNIPNNHQSCGLEMQFTESLTEINRQIMKEIRKNKELIKFHWLNKGNYLIKRDKDSESVRIQSIQQLNDVINEWRTTSSTSFT